MSRLHFAKYRTESRFTHYLFRYPAKFHPPVIRSLIQEYTEKGDTILDPFCGSGTLLVEALLRERNATGVDVDPLAVFISKVKSRAIPPKELEQAFACLSSRLDSICRPAGEYDRLMHDDLSHRALARFSRALAIPPIPNIEHWFRVYVALDLAKLRNAIMEGAYSPRTRDFFLACFASIIRNASNADPVPVSGLEVTAHMRELDKRGRRIDPFELFKRRVAREISGMKELWGEASRSTIRVARGDATALRTTLGAKTYDAIITSPPYNTAVDYYRRHMLEMYWLNLVGSHEERLAIAPRYLGRVQVRINNHRMKTTFESRYITKLIDHAKQISPARQRAVVHYCASMQRALSQSAQLLKRKGKAVFVIGNAKWNGRRVKATHLISELAKPHFDVLETLSYPSRNRYMSYTRHNGADINREHVLILQKRN